VLAGADGVMSQASALLSDPAIADVHGSASQLRALLASLSRVVADQRGELQELTASLRRSAEGIEQTATAPELLASVERLEQVTWQAQSIAASLERSSGALETILGRLERGEGTLGRLSTDDSLYVDVQLAARSIQRAGDEVTSLVAAVKDDPKGHLKMSVF
jgi:phospholipid/cholesterol/gamma-HCH transport system substrate-binding protein